MATDDSQLCVVLCVKAAGGRRKSVAITEIEERWNQEKLFPVGCPARLPEE